MHPTQTSHTLASDARSARSGGGLALSAIFLALVCLLAGSRAGNGALGQDVASASRRAPAPQVSNLQVMPRRISEGRATIRFTLDRGGKVTLVRLREAGSESGEGFKYVLRHAVGGEAGGNRVRVKATRLGYRPGRYLLRAQTVRDDGGTGDFAATSYRRVR